MSVAVPVQRTEVSRQSAYGTATKNNQPRGIPNSVPRIAGPNNVIEFETNSLTTQNLHIVEVDIPGVSDQTELHEMSMLFNVKMNRPDFDSKHVAMSLWKVNVFLGVMHAEAMEFVRNQGLTGLSETRINRLMNSDRKYEMLQFLSARKMHQVISFVGIQFGNRYLNARTGPGIAVITSGSAEMRNTCLNDTHEQDELWLILRRPNQTAPLRLELRSFRHTGGPRMSDREFTDMAGIVSYGPATKIGHIADKPRPDIQNDQARLMANGITGRTDQNHSCEMNAPPFRIVLCSTGIKAHQT